MTAVDEQTGTVEIDPELRAADGRVPGRRGLATRQKLLSATRELVDSVA